MKKKKSKKIITIISFVLCLALFSTTNVFAGAENFTEEITYKGNTYKMVKTDGFFTDNVTVTCEQTGEKTIVSQRIFSDKLQIENSAKHKKTNLTIEKSDVTVQYSENQQKLARKSKGKYKYQEGKTVNMEARYFGYKSYQHTKKTNGRKYKCVAKLSNKNKWTKTKYYKRKSPEWKDFRKAVNRMDTTNKKIGTSMGVFTASLISGVVASETGIGIIVGIVGSLGGGVSAVHLALDLHEYVGDAIVAYQDL